VSAREMALVSWLNGWHGGLNWPGGAGLGSAGAGGTGAGTMGAWSDGAGSATATGSGVGCGLGVWRTTGCGLGVGCGAGGGGVGSTLGWGSSIRSAITWTGTTSSTARRNRPVCRAHRPAMCRPMTAATMSRRRFMRALGVTGPNPSWGTVAVAWVESIVYVQELSGPQDPPCCAQDQEQAAAEDGQ